MSTDLTVGSAQTSDAPGATGASDAGPADTAAGGPDATGGDFDIAAAWVLNPSVALRPEPFGALLYHFGTRKLSFLKNLTVVDLARSLADHPSAAAALDASGIAEPDRPMYLEALTSLARSATIVPATPSRENP